MTGHTKAEELLRRVADYFASTKMGEPDAYHNPGSIKELRAAIDAALREQTQQEPLDMGAHFGGAG